MQAHGPAGGWQLQGEGRDQGVYDFVVISHNGGYERTRRGLACGASGSAADPQSVACSWLLVHAQKDGCGPASPHSALPTLLSMPCPSAPAGKCANRLVGPTGAPLVAKQLMGLRLSAVWVTMVAFAGSVPAPFEGAAGF